MFKQIPIITIKDDEFYVKFLALCVHVERPSTKKKKKKCRHISHFLCHFYRLKMITLLRSLDEKRKGESQQCKSGTGRTRRENGITFGESKKTSIYGWSLLYWNKKGRLKKKKKGKDGRGIRGGGGGRRPCRRGRGGGGVKSDKGNCSCLGFTTCDIFCLRF